MSYQSSYVNSALLKELISNNKLITIFQNAARLRSGKLSRQTYSDMSVRWLLHAYHSLPSIASKITIVPVMISYDRIFEHLNLATEMMSGEKKDYTFLSSMANIYQRKEN
jgi:glycerol-3-phosphate O-acyltransferase